MPDNLATTKPSRPVQVFALSADRIVDLESAAGRSAGEYVGDLLLANGVTPQDGDVVAVTSKIVSFHEGYALRLSDVTPSRKARLLGRAFRKDPREVQVMMEIGHVAVVIPMMWLIRFRPLFEAISAQSPNPAAMRRGFSGYCAYTFMVAAHASYVDDAGIDYSNAPGGVITILPKDPCAVAERIRTAVRDRFGVDVAVILTDTATKLGRVGSNDIAIGYAGLDPITRLTFSEDLFGVPRSGGVDLVIDSLAGMAGLVMGQTTEMRPAILIRGLSYDRAPAGAEADGMRSLQYPRGTLWRGIVLTLAASLWFRIVSLLAFQRWPRRTRA
ncbi:MAG: coenzyme F420-0:L-glutamate ligase [Candidatus Bipolaricaulia bacterium]